MNLRIIRVFNPLVVGSMLEGSVPGWGKGKVALSVVIKVTLKIFDWLI